MIVENLQTLKIHKLTEAQYQRTLSEGNIDPNALYLTPDESLIIDNTLSIDGAAADAKVTGDRIYNSRRWDGWIDTDTGVYIDTAAKTITFGANTHICWGNQRHNVGNTVHDISSMMSGNFMFYDPVNDVITTSTATTRNIYLGAFWKPYHLVDLHMDKTKLYIDGMPITYVGKYNGKTINCLGDSITAGVGTTKAYHQWFGQLCGFKTINNYGVGGSSITPIGSHEPAWTGEENIQSFYERYSDMGDADVVSVMGCVNDWIAGRELGSITDTTTDTFYGTMKLLCEGLIAKYPTADIYFFSSPQCDYAHRPANKLRGTQWEGNTEGFNRKGYKIQDYAHAMSEVCAIYGIPFMNLTDNCYWGLSGVLGEYENDNVNGAYGSDSLHPNAEGHKKIALKMSSVINNGYGNSPVANEPRYELIEKVEITEDNVASINLYHDLDKLILYINCPIASTTVNCGIDVYKSDVLAGYAWLNNMAATSSARVGCFEARNENGLVVCENTTPQNDAERKSNAAVNRKAWKVDGKGAFTRIRIFGGSGAAFPIGTVFELWGVKA